MLDNILNTVKRASERVQRRGEEVAQVARLRMEIFGLNRELDGAYARLGRAYHGGSDVDLLQGIRGDIARIEEEMAARERLITELGGDSEETVDVTGQDGGGATLVKVGPPASAPTVVQNNSPDFSDGAGDLRTPGKEPTVPDAIPPESPRRNDL